MNRVLKGCLLLAIVAGPAFAQTDKQVSNAMNCPMMTDQMQKQMGTMMSDMRAIMEGTKDPAAKSRMQAMHERMGGMMANMQKMHGGMIGAAPQAPKEAEPPAAATPDAGKQNHEEHHPRP